MPTPKSAQSNKKEIIETNSLAPLTTIRTETVLSRLPIHNLAKKGRIDIRIMRKNADGELDLQWDVSYNERYGQPRQLAYKLDSLVINRKIDEIGRPLPKIIRLNSLHEIAQELDLTRNTNKVKKAILQNAAAFITAKLRYIGTDDIERTLEAAFNRYSVIFTGQRMPDGSKADAVYLVLTEPYWEVLNNAPTRPLDYQYLKALTPAAQRFYEIVSYKIYAALKYGHATAKISYAEYCTYSAQQRYEDYEHVKKQLYKIHRPHLQSGYLKKVSCEPTADVEGKPDWLLFYTPGPKARAEYAAFNQKKRKQNGELRGATEALPQDDEDPSSGADAAARDLVRDFHRRFHKVANHIPQAKEIEHAERLIATHGIEKARHLLEFSHKSASATEYQPQIFGGILQYEAQAIADFDQRKSSRQNKATADHCVLCNKHGLIDMSDAKGRPVAVQCSHNLSAMKAHAEKRGYRFDQKLHTQEA